MLLDTILDTIRNFRRHVVGESQVTQVFPQKCFFYKNNTSLTMCSKTSKIFCETMLQKKMKMKFRNLET